MKKAVILYFLLISASFAQDEELSKALNNSNYEPSYIGMLFGLFLVIALVYLTGFIYKKLTKIKLESSGDDKYSIQVVTSTALGQNKNLFVVKVNNSYSLIGATQNNITYIKDLGEDNENQNRKKDIRG